jgi:hypothetical protein
MRRVAVPMKPDAMTICLAESRPAILMVLKDGSVQFLN